MHRRRPVRLNVRRCFFLNRGHNDVEPLGPGCVQHEQREASIPGDQADRSAMVSMLCGDVLKSLTTEDTKYHEAIYA